MPSVLSQPLMAACAFGNAKREAARTSHHAMMMKKLRRVCGRSDGLENEQGSKRKRETEGNVHPLYEERDVLASVAEVQAIVFSAIWKIWN